MRIQIKSTQVEVKKGTSGRTGRAYEIREQTAFVSHADEIRKVLVPLGRDQTAYAPGDYEIAPESFEVNRFQNLEIGRLQLVPATAAKNLSKVG